MNWTQKEKQRKTQQLRDEGYRVGFNGGPRIAPNESLLRLNPANLFATIMREEDVQWLKGYDKGKRKRDSLCGGLREMFVCGRFGHNRQKAFTLIELMITCLIIVVLVSLAVPSFLTYRLRAEEQKAIATLHAYAQAQEAYWFEQPGTALEPNEYCSVIDDLRSFVDLLGSAGDNDGDWVYSTNGDATTFTVTAAHLDVFGAQDGLEMQIDQTGTVVRSAGVWPY